MVGGNQVYFGGGCKLVQIGCDCKERYGTEIDSYYLFEELKSFFEEQVRKESIRRSSSY